MRIPLSQWGWFDVDFLLQEEEERRRDGLGRFNTNTSNNYIVQWNY